MRKHKKHSNRRNDVKFTNKDYSRRGILSLAGSAISLIWLIYAVIQTSRLGDNTDHLIGGIGVLILLLQLAALVTAIRANREEDVFRGIPKAALVAAILLLLLWIAVYGLGVAVLFGVL